jgi:hypothetical protein
MHKQSTSTLGQYLDNITASSKQCTKKISFKCLSLLSHTSIILQSSCSSSTLPPNMHSNVMSCAVKKPEITFKLKVFLDIMLSETEILSLLVSRSARRNPQALVTKHYLERQVFCMGQTSCENQTTNEQYARHRNACMIFSARASIPNSNLLNDNATLATIGVYILDATVLAPIT